MAEVNKITGLVVGQYGTALQFTIVDANGSAVDISSYATAKTAYLRSPYDNKLVTHDATFVTDGTNGQIKFTPATGEIDRPGLWTLQFKLATASAVVYTSIASVLVERALG
jgi:baseplate upper protein BppU